MGGESCFTSIISGNDNCFRENPLIGKRAASQFAAGISGNNTILP